MAMYSEADLDRIRGAVAYDRSGHRIGDVGEVFLDDDTGVPLWVSVRTGLFGGHHTIAPLQGSHLERPGHLVLPHDGAVVTGAPQLREHGHLDSTQEEELYAHYGVPDPHADIAAERRRTRRWINEGGPLLPGD